MKKVLLALIATGSVLAANSNTGFLTNQKYICVTQGYLTNGKLTPTPQEEAMKHPIRFYVDDNNVLHTDSNMALPHADKYAYSDGDNAIGIMVTKGKRYLVSTNKKLSALDVHVMYICAETKNWTIAK